jgi:hypothetical protein
MLPQIPPGDRPVQQSQARQARLADQGRAVQGCACPTCYNIVWADDVGPILCRRCYRARCHALGSLHRGPDCTMRDCPHSDHP